MSTLNDFIGLELDSLTIQKLIPSSTTQIRLKTLFGFNIKNMIFEMMKK